MGATYGTETDCGLSHTCRDLRHARNREQQKAAAAATAGPPRSYCWWKVGGARAAGQSHKDLPHSMHLSQQRNWARISFQGLEDDSDRLTVPSAFLKFTLVCEDKIPQPLRTEVFRKIKYMLGTW